MIGSEFVNAGQAIHQPCRCMHREGSGIVIRMAAFIWMGKNYSGLSYPEQRDETAGQLRQMQGGFLIGQADRIRALRSDARHAQRAQQLAAPRLRICFRRIEPCRVRVSAVPRRTVRDMNNRGRRELWKKRSCPDYLVIGMRRYNCGRLF